MTAEVDGKTKVELRKRFLASDLKNRAKVVMCALVDIHSNTHGCTAGYTYLEERSGNSDATIKRALKELKAAGLITWRKGYNVPGKMALTNRYTINWKWREGGSGSTVTLGSSGSGVTDYGGGSGSNLHQAGEHGDARVNPDPNHRSPMTRTSGQRRPTTQTLRDTTETPPARTRAGKGFSNKTCGRSADEWENLFNDIIAELTATGQYQETWGWGASCRGEVEALRRACGDERAYRRLQAMRDKMHGQVLRDKLSEAAREAVN